MELELLAVGGAVDVAGAEAFASLDDERELDVVGKPVGQPARRGRNPEALEGLVRGVLVAHLGHDLGGREEHGRPELLAVASEDELVEVGERDDEVDVVVGNEARQLGHVLRVADARHELVVVSVVERRREAVDVGRDRGRSGPAEGGHDVDALHCAGEKYGCHGVRA